MLWTLARRAPLVHLPQKARVFPLGTGKVDETKALLRFEDGWVIDDTKKEGWAVVGDSEGRRLAVETLLGKNRITPTSSTPALPVNQATPPTSVSPDSWKPVRYLAFARPSPTGEFTDYTARYGALLDEDRYTLRQKLMRSAAALPGQTDSPVSEASLNTALSLMGLEKLADLPAVSLSSGQTRRARIAQALAYSPRLLVLEDPMAGLDVESRAKVSDLLGELNNGEMRVVLVLRDRGEDTLADWVTDVVDVRAGVASLSSAEEWKARRHAHHHTTSTTPSSGPSQAEPEGEPVAELSDVSIAYGEGARPVLKNISWRILPGSKWHLQGANGSGKTTLLSVLLGHHPQSYSLPSSSLTLFGEPRRKVATTSLRRRIGHCSPEVFAAFPRSMGLNAYEAVGTGFEGVFARRSLTPDQKARVLALLARFRDLLSPQGISVGEEGVKEIARREFSHFTPPQQALLLFLRAVVGRPELLVLDEPTQGMDEEIWDECRRFLREEWEEQKKDGTQGKEGREQAVIVVSHYEDEVPWGGGRVLRLKDGVAEIA